MHEIITEVERTSDIYYDISLEDEYLDVPEAIAASASLTAMKVKAKAVVCLTTTGKTATLISGFRPQVPIVAITHQLDSLNRLELVWGIQTYKIHPYQNSEEALTQIEELLIKIGMVSKGDLIVVTIGTPVQQRAKTNTVRVYTVTKDPIKVANSDLPMRCRNDIANLVK
jgi:pyruvate kinase